MEHIDVVCPEPEFKLFVRKKLETKVSWTMAGVVVSICAGVAFLVFNAYSRGQEEQTTKIVQNSSEVQELKTNVKVMQTEFTYVREKLGELKSSQKEQFEAVLKELKEIKQKGGRE
uniref:Uncharacterized protein n=1 Tax=viral metagenome TaxID=1070528 RepID=A0A6H1ZD26_9ZZZZ